MKKQISVAVHNGVFHADDVLCVALLKQYGYETIIIRTREPEEYEKCDFVLDVGREDKVTDTQVKFDHHQASSFVRKNGVKAAACGKLADWLYADDPEFLEKLHAEVLDAVEAQDNGQNLPNIGNNMFSFVSMFNPNWDESADDESMMDRFIIAEDAVEAILILAIRRIKSSLAAKELVKEAIDQSFNGVVVLNRFMPWQETVCEANDHGAKLRLVVYPNSSGTFNVQSVPLSYGSFEFHVGMWWNNETAESMAEKYALQDFIFCHRGGFISGWRTLTYAMRAAGVALAMHYRDR